MIPQYRKQEQQYFSSRCFFQVCEPSTSTVESRVSSLETHFSPLGKPDLNLSYQ